MGATGIVWVMLWCDMAWGNDPGGTCRIPDQWTTVAESRVSLPLFTSKDACQQDELNRLSDAVRRMRSIPADPVAPLARKAPSPDEAPPKFDESGRLYATNSHTRWGECRMLTVYDKPTNNY
jgi:hypothetical protein